MNHVISCFAAMMVMAYVAVGSVSVQADTLRVFAISGLFRTGAVLSGTLTIDEDAGRVVSCDVKVTGRKTLRFQRVEKQTVVGMAAVVVLVPADRKWPRLVLGETTFPGSLRDYMGGPLGRRTDIVHNNDLRQLILSGHLVALPAGSH